MCLLANRIPPRWEWRQRADGAWIGPPGWLRQTVLFRAEGDGLIAWIADSPSRHRTAATAKDAVNAIIVASGLDREPVRLEEAPQETPAT